VKKKFKTLKVFAFMKPYECTLTVGLCADSRYESWVKELLIELGNRKKWFQPEFSKVFRYLPNFTNIKIIRV